MSSQEKSGKTYDGNEDVTNGYRTSDEEKPLQKNNRIRRESLAKIELQVDQHPKETPPTTRGTYGGLRANLSMPEKTKLPFLFTIVLCVLLLIAIIVLIAFWPQIPYHMKAPICIDKECMDASKQILTWANTSANVCQDTYEWACGNFRNDYEEQNIYEIHKGEWNMKSSLDYEEIRELHSLISMLPANDFSYSTASMLKSLYKSCREIETMDKSQADTLLKKIIRTLDSWRALRDGKGLQTWDYRKALIHVQSIYGAFPFFKISVGKRFTPPYGNIIVLKEGETGLPHKVFYNLDPTNKIVHAYKMLLRDFALNMGVIGEESELFADEIFHYEKRIVNQIMLTEKSTDNGVNQITTLGELKKQAPSLPVFEAMQAIFSKTKITEETEVLVENVNVIQEMSIIVSTSDKQPLNDFIIWAVARKLLPYLSREYNVLVEKFEQELFGGKLITPKWFFCTKVIQNMMTFAIDALQENTTRISISTDTERRKHALERKILLGDELFKLIFYHIRNELQSHLEHAAEIREPKRTLIMEKLSSIKLQIGLPDAALETAEYVNKYYEAFLLQNLFFAEHLESFWNFKRVRMENSLKPLRLVDLIIAELYSSVKLPRIAFSPSMNMAIITRRHLQASYFNYKYPISINFARIGSDIAQFFLEATSFYLHEERINSTSPLEQIFNLKCLKKVTEYQNSTLSTAAVMKLYNKISAAKLTSKAFKTFLNVIENAEPILGKVISEVTYEDLGLVKKRRQPGLRHLNEEQLFSLTLLQNHCSVSNDVINNFKQFIENEVPENKTFYALWNYVPYVSGSLYCPTERRRCFRIL